MIPNKNHSFNIRKNILIEANSAGLNGAHISPSLSCVDILVSLYSNIMKFDKNNLSLQGRDRFILSKGHAGLALYATLAEFGIITQEEFKTFEKNGGNLPGQPSKNIPLGIEFSGGSLGLGLSYAIGLLKGNNSNAEFNVYVLMGDGELNEGSVWESVMFAGYNKLKNLSLIIDYNKMQSDGNTEDILNFDISGMLKSCNWDVVECDGHNVEEITQTLRKSSTSKPLAVIAHTVKGKGVAFMENNAKWHHSRLTETQMNEAINQLENFYGF